MADKKKTVPNTLLEPEAPVSDWQRAIGHVQENPLLYAVGLIIIVLVAALGGIFTMSRTIANREFVTRYTNAMESEEAATRAAELEVLADVGGDPWALEAAYMMAENAIRAGELSRAKETFEQIVAQAPESRYAPRAAEGLAFLAENAGDLDAALAGYQEVADRWQNSFEGRIQHTNIARILEKQGKIEEAIEHLNQQIEVFPDSRTAANADTELTRLKGLHPDLFPEDEAVADDAAEDDAVDEDIAEDDAAEDSDAEATDATDTAAEVESEEAVEAVVETMKETGDAVQEVVEDAVEEAADAAETVEETVEDAVEAVEDAAESVVEDAVEAVEETAEDAVGAVEEAVESAADAVDEAADAAGNASTPEDAATPES